MARAEPYRRALTEGPGLSLVPLGDEVAVLAARLRVRYRQMLPDAFQVAASVLHGCEALATNDREFRRVRDVRILDVE